MTDSSGAIVYQSIIRLLAGLPGDALAFNTLKYDMYAPTPGAPPKFSTHLQHCPGSPRPMCEDSANVLHWDRQTDRQLPRQSIYIDIDQSIQEAINQSRVVNSTRNRSSIEGNPTHWDQSINHNPQHLFHTFWHILLHGACSWIAINQYWPKTFPDSSISSLNPTGWCGRASRHKKLTPIPTGG